jgi:hypothetical protein
MEERNVRRNKGNSITIMQTFDVYRIHPYIGSDIFRVQFWCQQYSDRFTPSTPLPVRHWRPRPSNEHFSHPTAILQPLSQHHRDAKTAPIWSQRGATVASHVRDGRWPAKQTSNLSLVVSDPDGLHKTLTLGDVGAWSNRIWIQANEAVINDAERGL